MNTVTHDQSGQSDISVLYHYSLATIKSMYASGRINQAEYEIYSHLWNMTHNKSCNCCMCLVKDGKKDEFYSWLKEIDYQESYDIYCAFGWPEGQLYHINDKNLFDISGFKFFQRTLETMLKEIK